MCAFHFAQASAALEGLPAFTTRGAPMNVSCTPPDVCPGLLAANPFSFFALARQHGTPVQGVVSEVPALSRLNSDTDVKQLADLRSVSRSSPLSRSLSSFAISSASDQLGSATSTRPPSPVPQLALCQDELVLRGLGAPSHLPACPRGVTVEPQTSLTTSCTAADPVMALSLAQTTEGAKQVFRLVTDGIHADEVIDAFLCATVPWFSPAVLVIALCLMNRYTARFPDWYASNHVAVEMEATREQSGTKAKTQLSEQNAPRTLLAALLSATKLYADTTYQAVSLCRVWNEKRKALNAESVGCVQKSSMATVLTPTRLSAAEWRLLEELGYSALVGADEYNICLQEIADYCSGA